MSNNTIAWGQKVSGAWQRVICSDYLVLFLTLAYFVVMLPLVPGMGSEPNLANLLSNMLPLLVVAVGQQFVLIGGGIDLSVTSTIALASVTGAFAMNGDTGWVRGGPLAVLLGTSTMLGTGAAVGLLNGVAVTRFRMPAFIVTLTTMMFVSGFAIWLTKSNNVANLPPAFNALGGKTLSACIITGLLCLLAHVVLSRSLFGRWLYAVGHNPKTAYISGVPVVGVTLSTYVIAGLCAAVASIIYTGRLETASPVHGQGILLDVIGATVIGGTSLFGGKGKVMWTVCGVLFLVLIDNSLNLLSRSHFEIMMVKGAVILGAALMDTLRNRKFSAA